MTKRSYRRIAKRMRTFLYGSECLLFKGDEGWRDLLFHHLARGRFFRYFEDVLPVDVFTAYRRVRNFAFATIVIERRWLLLFTCYRMAPKQKMRLANEKHSKNVMNRGNVPKSLVSTSNILLYFGWGQCAELKLYRSRNRDNAAAVRICGCIVGYVCAYSSESQPMWRWQLHKIRV